MNALPYTGRGQSVKAVADYVRKKYAETKEPVVIKKKVLASLIKTTRVEEQQIVRYALLSEPDIRGFLVEKFRTRNRQPYAYVVDEKKNEKPIDIHTLRVITEPQLEYLQERLLVQNRSLSAYAKLVLLVDIFLLKNPQNLWSNMGFSFLASCLVVPEEAVLTFVQFLQEREVMACRKLDGQDMYRVAFSRMEFRQLMENPTKAPVKEEINPNSDWARQVKRLEQISQGQGFVNKGVQAALTNLLRAIGRAVNESQVSAEEMRNLKAQLESLQVENDKLKQESNEFHAQQDKLQTDFMTTKEECTKVKQALSEMETSLAEALQRREEAEEKVQELNQQVTSANDNLDKARAAFQSISKDFEQMRSDFDAYKQKTRYLRGYERDVAKWKQQILQKTDETLSDFNVQMSMDVLRLPPSVETSLKSRLLGRGQDVKTRIYDQITRILNGYQENQEGKE